MWENKVTGHELMAQLNVIARKEGILTELLLNKIIERYVDSYLKNYELESRYGKRQTKSVGGMVI